MSRLSRKATTPTISKILGKPRLRDEQIDAYWLGDDWMLQTVAVFPPVHSYSFVVALRDAHKVLPSLLVRHDGYALIPESFYYERTDDPEHGKGWIFGVFLKRPAKSPPSDKHSNPQRRHDQI